MYKVHAENSLNIYDRSIQKIFKQRQQDNLAFTQNIMQKRVVESEHQKKFLGKMLQRGIYGDQDENLTRSKLRSKTAVKF
jgi:hypothetical protein